MENDIEVCSASDEAMDVQINSGFDYDLISRYYQILVNIFENGSSEC